MIYPFFRHTVKFDIGNGYRLFVPFEYEKNTQFIRIFENEIQLIDIDNILLDSFFVENAIFMCLDLNDTDSLKNLVWNFLNKNKMFTCHKIERKKTENR